MEDTTNNPEEQYIEAPNEDNEADAELVAALRERAEEDLEEADESVERRNERVPMTLRRLGRQARP